MIAMLFLSLAYIHCQGSTRHEACMEWYMSCLSSRHAASNWRGIDHEEENCAENIPIELTKGM